MLAETLRTSACLAGNTFPGFLSGSPTLLKRHDYPPSQRQTLRIDPVASNIRTPTLLLHVPSRETASTASSSQPFKDSPETVWHARRKREKSLQSAAFCIVQITTTTTNWVSPFSFLFLVLVSQYRPLDGVSLTSSHAKKSPFLKRNKTFRPPLPYVLLVSLSSTSHCNSYHLHRCHFTG